MVARQNLEDAASRPPAYELPKTARICFQGVLRSVPPSLMVSREGLEEQARRSVLARLRERSDDYVTARADGSNARVLGGALPSLCDEPADLQVEASADINLSENRYTVALRPRGQGSALIVERRDVTQRGGRLLPAMPCDDGPSASDCNAARFAIEAMNHDIRALTRVLINQIEFK